MNRDDDHDESRAGSTESAHVSGEPDELGARLEALRLRTQELTPGDDFERRVMAAVRAPRSMSGWAPAFLLIEQFALPMTALALGAAVLVGIDGALGWQRLWSGLAQALVETLS